MIELEFSILPTRCRVFDIELSLTKAQYQELEEDYFALNNRLFDLLIASEILTENEAKYYEFDNVDVGRRDDDISDKSSIVEKFCMGDPEYDTGSRIYV